MIRQRPQLTFSVFAAMILVAVVTHADDFVEPERVVMTERPLTTEQARVMQKAWADHLGFDVAYENSIGMRLRVIPPGTYPMGRPKAAEAHKRPVEVTLGQAFLIGQFEVTQAEWERVMGAIETKLDVGAGDRLPMYSVNHTEATKFCRKLTLLDREAGKLPDGYGYRLPTDAEWEYACRAGTVTATHFGDKLSSTQANFDGDRPFNGAEKGPYLGKTAKVGGYPANAWGLHDMHANIGEWCLDYYHRGAKAGVDPVQLQPAPESEPHRKNRLIRGGSFKGPAGYSVSANRYFERPEARRSHLGFRPVLSKLYLDSDDPTRKASLQDPAEPKPVVMTEQPLTTEQAKATQKAWADHLGFKVAFENSIGMQLRVIPPGSYRMSSPHAELGRKGPVEVSLSQAYLIGQFEVTQGEWERVMGPIEQKLDVGAGDQFPIYRINHTEASEFCRKLTQLEREAGKLPNGYQYRLPTEVEWEFACRAGTLTRTHFGENMSSQLANYDGNFPLPGSPKGPRLGRTAEVGTYPANAWGLHEIHGNVNEWCLDWYHRELKEGVDPVHLLPPTSGQPAMVIRDCSWRGNGRYCYTTHRTHRPPDWFTNRSGFRAALTKVLHGKITAKTHADDSAAPKSVAMPEPVVMTELPLTTEQARNAQNAWADHLGVDAIFENAIGMQLSVIPPGTFPMGIANFKPVEPQEVTHSQPYFIGRYEVTQGEWEQVMGRAVGWQQKTGVGDRIPAYGINYAEAVEFCWKLTEIDREAGKLPEGYEYRLPTHAELEFACRAGTLTATYFGDTLSSRQANFDGGIPYNGAENGPFLNRLTEVGSYPGNAWGLHDTHGNVAEWCLDWYHSKPKGGVDPVHLLPSPEHSIPQRVDKGGRYLGPGRYCLSSNRYFHLPEDRAIGLGLRPVVSKLHLDGFHRPTYGRHTDFNQAWTRDGTNLRIWHKWNAKDRVHYVMSGSIDHIPGTTWATPLTSHSYHTWAYTCLTDGRILVLSNPPDQEMGYYLMTPNKNAPTKYEPVQCDLATKGVLHRISLSPSETKVCFEFRTGFEDNAPSRSLYMADFDAKDCAINNATPFANEDEKPIWYAFPRWTKDESAIIYQADEKLYLYNLANKSTTKMSTTAPHVKRAPK